MRVRVFVFILIAAFLFVMSGLIHIQIVKHESFKVMSEENRLRIVPFIAPRGSIFDAEGRAMVKDVLSFNASVYYSQIKDKPALVKVFSEVLDLPAPEVEKRIKKGRAQPYSPTVIARDIGTEKAIHLEEIALDYPGLSIDVSARREYVNASSGGNMLGYLGLLNSEEVEKFKHYGYKVNDPVGRSGIEKYYDNYLRGTHGGKQVEVDSMGREVITIGHKEPVPGRDIYLTINQDLQKFCDSLLENTKGAIIAMNPYSGAIVVMASSPSFDPGIFMDPKRQKEVQEILSNSGHPLLNRAISTAQPPGSIFKVVIAIAGLESGKISDTEEITCGGIFTLGRSSFHCWRKDGHGPQIMREAIKNSCNVYFYTLGLRVGVDDIANFACEMGVGTKTGVDLPEEVSGTLPTKKWKEKRFKEKWYKGETVNYAIGQGYLLCTPLQIARIMSVFANGGVLVHPYIASRIGDVKINNYEGRRLSFSDESINVVREGLWKVVNDKRGTGMKARQKDFEVAGKTGTAQTSQGENHGWFAGFGPYKNPTLTVVVFDEHGGKGGYYAAQTAGKVFAEAKRLGLV